MTTLSEYIVDNISESILSSTRTGKAGIDEELRQYGLDPAKATLNADGTIDYDGDVMLSSKHLTRLPFRFRTVTGVFYCFANELTTLDGCPIVVKDDFDCISNKLVNLKGGPKQVYGFFACYNNDLTTLEGAPEKIKGFFDCSHNNLTSLKGGPEQVGGNYDCSCNSLISLEGLPKKLKKQLFCYNNPGAFTKEDVLKLCKIDKNKMRT